MLFYVVDTDRYNIPVIFKELKLFVEFELMLPSFSVGDAITEI